MTPFGLWLLGTMAATLPYDEATSTWRFPENSMGEMCEMPLDPLFMAGAPIGMYHCPYCGDMVIAAIPHPDFRDINLALARQAAEEAKVDPDVGF